MSNLNFSFHTFSCSNLVRSFSKKIRWTPTITEWLLDLEVTVLARPYWNFLTSSEFQRRSFEAGEFTRSTA
jgi:hypothetical protein